MLPKKFFGYLKPGSSTPSYNILLIGVLAFAGAELLYHIGNAYEHAGELLNFGAFLAFVGVNFATFWQFTVIAKRNGSERRFLRDALHPLVGFAFCGLIWWNLNNLAKAVGGIWFAVGILYRLQNELVPLGAGHDRLQRLLASLLTKITQNPG